MLFYDNIERGKTFSSKRMLFPERRKYEVNAVGKQGGGPGARGVGGMCGVGLHIPTIT